MFRFKLLYFKSGRKNKLHSEYNISHFCKRFSLFRHCRWKATHILFKFSQSCQWSSAQKLNSDSLSVWVTLGVKQSFRVIGFDLLKHWRVAYKLDGSSHDLISVYDLWWTVTHSLDGPRCQCSADLISMVILIS